MQEKEFTKWVTAWGNAISIADRKPENYAKNLTLRYPIKCLLSGNKIRLTFDNFCGQEAVKIAKVTVAYTRDGNRIQTDTLRTVTFAQKESIEIAAGQRVKSDEVAIDIRKGMDITVIFYLADFTQMRSAVCITGPLSRGYYAIGNHTESEELPLKESRKTEWFYFLSDIEVFTTQESHAIVCFGDSITAQAWPDNLALRVLEKEEIQTSIIRKAASGTRILRQYDNITYESYGLKGETRFPREIQVSGADTVIIQHGINDIIHPVGVEVNPFRPWSDMPTLEDLCKGLQFYIDYAKAKKLKIYLGTLLPIYGWRTYEPFREELRNQLNEWIRKNTEVDGCIDFDQALRDENHFAAFAERYDSGDHLHPSLKAYEKMAQIVPAEIF